MQSPIPDKPPNQQQQSQPQMHQQNLWANNSGWPPYQMGYYGNQMPYGQSGAANNPYNMQYMQYNQNQQPTAQQIAFRNANEALMRNGLPTSYVPPIPSMPMGTNSGVSGNSDSNILPPLPPGPPPPMNGQQQFHSTPTSSAASVYQSSAPMYYGQAANSGPHIAFNMANKKTGLGYQPPLNNSGAGKKKRKKNKNRLQFNNAFQSAGTGHTFPLTTPPLPSETPPPFPPLPPLPSEPCKKPPTPPHLMDAAEIFAASKAMNQNLPPNLGDFSRPPPSSPATSKASADALPESLKAYVNRCYEKCIEDVDKDQVEIILKGKITRALQDNSMWTKNWDLELLPRLHSENTPEAKKPFPSNTMPTRSPVGPTPSQRGSPLVGKRGRGLSAAMGSRLGGFGRGQRRPSPKTFNAAGKMVRARRSRTRSRTRSPSRSPVRRRKDRSVTSSSSSSSDSYVPFTPTRGKKRGASGSSMTGRQSLDSKETFMSKRAKKRLRREESKAGKSHFYSEHGTIGSAEPVDSERLQTRAARFHSTLRNPSPSTGRTPKRVLGLGVPTAFRGFDDEVSDVDWKNFHIVGTCRDVDKEYFRQITAPDPSTIRPVDVLKKALVAVQENWKLKSDYYFTCNRMKSIRLDLTLQNVRTEFTVQVYETHARIALEKGDHQELNQCLSQLTRLYVDVGGANRLEFTAYGVLYYIFTKDTLELTTLLGRLTEADKADPCVAHAIAVRTAWVTSNYHRFFRLYKEAPKMAGYAVELFVDRERLSALKIMIKAYRPTLPVSHVKKELAFESHSKCLEFLDPLGLAFADPQRTKIECKLSTPIVTKL